MTFEELATRIIALLQEATTHTENNDPENNDPEDNAPDGTFEGYLMDSGFDRINKED